MARIYQVPRSYPGSSTRSKPRKKSTRSSCRCPTGAKMLSTGGRGRGFVCQSSKPRTVRKRGRTWRIRKPFVRAICR